MARKSLATVLEVPEYQSPKLPMAVSLRANPFSSQPGCRGLSNFELSNLTPAPPPKSQRPGRHTHNAHILSSLEVPKFPQLTHCMCTRMPQDFEMQWQWHHVLSSIPRHIFRPPNPSHQKSTTVVATSLSPCSKHLSCCCIVLRTAIPGSF